MKKIICRFKFLLYSHYIISTMIRGILSKMIYCRGTHHIKAWEIGNLIFSKCEKCHCAVKIIIDQWDKERNI